MIEFWSNVPAPDTSKTCNLQLRSGRVGAAQVGSAWSNSDYKAISASQQSWSLGLADLGKIEEMGVNR